MIAFIAQLDLSDVAAVGCLDESQTVQAHGMLYCFAEQESSTPTHRLIYVPEPGELARRAAPQVDELADPDQQEPFPELLVSRLVPSDQKREDEEVIFHIESHFEKGAPPMSFWDAGYLEVTTKRGRLGKDWTSTEARIFSM